jgi:hypothetical protein
MEVPRPADRQVGRHKEQESQNLAATWLPVWLPIVGLGWLPWPA